MSGFLKILQANDSKTGSSIQTAESSTGPVLTSSLPLDKDLVLEIKQGDDG